MEHKPVKRLDRRSKIPLHIQLSNTFRREILDGVYDFNEVLPSLEDLAKQLDLSIDNLKKSFDLLAKERLVYYDSPDYRCKFKAVPAVIFQRVSDFRYIIESRGMHYRVVDQPIDIINLAEERWITLHRAYFGDSQCFIISEARFKADSFPSLLHKTTSDTRNFAAIFQENEITHFNTLKTIDHISLPAEFVIEMDQPKNTSCSKTRYEVIQNNQTILISDSYIVGYGFRFNFLTNLEKI